MIRYEAREDPDSDGRAWRVVDIQTGEPVDLARTTVRAEADMRADLMNAMHALEAS